MDDLIDTKEMYLRTLFELGEEGIEPIRARIVDRIGHSMPTVSQTVTRMERDNLIYNSARRRIKLTKLGAMTARRVMRKHRLAEKLLADIIGLDWAWVHREACRWEHVMSTQVEKRLVNIMDEVWYSPYGNPIPALEELGLKSAREFTDGVFNIVSELQNRKEPIFGEIKRLAEPIQFKPEVLRLLEEFSIKPNVKANFTPPVNNKINIRTCKTGKGLDLSVALARHIFIAV